MLIFLNPLKNQQTSYASLDKVQNKLIKNLSVEYNYLALRVNPKDGNNKECFKLSYNSSMSKVIILSASGFIVKAKKENGAIIFKNTTDNFYNLYFSNEFNDYAFSSPNPNSCYELHDEEYSLGSLEDEKRILYEKFILLNKSYFEDYRGLKNELLLDKDFDFIVYNSSRYVLFDTTNIHKIKTGNVLAREIPLMAIDKDAQDKSLIISLRVW
jgi:hypothetical protein